MNIINKVTSLRVLSLTDEIVQSHFDEQNQDGWHLVAVDNLVGWYRFFWQKTIN